jgi:hypothetical protein
MLNVSEAQLALQTERAERAEALLIEQAASTAVQVEAPLLAKLGEAERWLDRWRRSSKSHEQRAEAAEARAVAAEAVVEGADIIVHQAEARVVALGTGLREALDLLQATAEALANGEDAEWGCEHGRLLALLAAGPDDVARELTWPELFYCAAMRAGLLDGHLPGILPDANATYETWAQELAAELAGLKACFDAHAPRCFGAFAGRGCTKLATKVSTSEPHASDLYDGATQVTSRCWCDAHAPADAVDLPWADAVRGAGK